MGCLASSVSGQPFSIEVTKVSDTAPRNNTENSGFWETRGPELLPLNQEAASVQRSSQAPSTAFMRVQNRMGWTHLGCLSSSGDLRGYSIALGGGICICHITLVFQGESCPSSFSRFAGLSWCFLLNVLASVTGQSPVCWELLRGKLSAGCSLGGAISLLD